MNAGRSGRALFGSLVVVLACATGAAAQPGGWCRGFYTVENKDRHFVGDANVECGGISIHSATWGNWGVSSNLGDLTNSAQFFGWHTSGSQAHWNSCTGDHNRDEDAVYYNHDHNGNGFGDDQWSPWPNPYASAAVDFEADCPIDYNGDGQCDSGGCFRLSAGAGFSGHFLSLYELDTPDADDFITTLNVDGNCCHFTPSFCNAQECGSGESNWYSTTSFTNSEAYAQVRMKMSSAEFTPSSYCLTLRDNYFQYNCY